MKRKNTFSHQLLEQQLREQGIVHWIKNNPTKAALAADWIYNYAQRNEPHSLERVGKALTDVGADVVNWGKKIWSGVTQGAQEKGITIPKSSPDSTQDKPQAAPLPKPTNYDQVVDPEHEDEFIKETNTYKTLSEKYEKYKQPEKSAFELEVEKNFTDPYVRAAIMAKARQESGGKNVGEYSYAKNSNDHIRTVFKGNKAIERLSDAELSTLKQNPTAFFDTAYGHLGGFKYRGRGPIQITGKANYARIDRDLGLKGELVKDPDLLLRNPELAHAASIQYLKNAGLQKKSYNNQRDAHLDVIYAIGGPSYAPNSWRSNKVYAQLIRTQGLPNTQKIGSVVPLGTQPDSTQQQPDSQVKTSNIEVPDSNAPMADKGKTVLAVKPDTEPVKTDGVPVKTATKPEKRGGVVPSIVPLDFGKSAFDKDDFIAETNVGTELQRTSGGQFMSKADRLNQAKVDAVLGPGFKAGRADTNIALAKKFRQAQPLAVNPPPADNRAPDAAKAPAVNNAAPAADNAGKDTALPRDTNTNTQQAQTPVPIDTFDKDYFIPETSKKMSGKYRNGSGAGNSVGKKIKEADVIDKALDTGKDILSNINTAGWAGTYLPKVPEKAKKLAARLIPITNAPLQAYDVVKRTKMGDPVGAAIAGISAIPTTPTMLGGMGLQAARDFARTGSAFPSDEELRQAAEKEMKIRAQMPEPFMLENKQMKRLTNLRVAVIKEEFRLKKSSMTEQEINERFFYYYDGKHTLFNENGEIIGHTGPNGQVVLTEAVPPWVEKAIRTGIEGSKKGVEFVKSGGLGRALDTTGQAIAAGTERLGKAGKFIVDKPLDAVTYPVKAFLNKAEEIRYKLPSGLSQEEKAKAISDRLSLQSQEILNAADRAALKHTEKMNQLEQARKKGEDKAIISKLEAEAKEAKGIADQAAAKAKEQQYIAQQVKSDTPIFGPREKQLAKIGGITTGVGLAGAGATDALLQYDTEKGLQDYVPGAGFQPKIKEIPPLAPPSAVQENKQSITEKQVKDMTWAEFWRWATGQEQFKPAPAPAPEPPKPAPAPEPKTEPKKEKDDDPRLRGDYTVNRDPDAEKVPYTPRQQPDSGSDKVRAMQKKLRDSGYGELLGKFGPEGDGVDGKWGRHTQRAYDAYMADRQAKREIAKTVDTGPGIAPTVPVKAYLDNPPDLSKIKDTDTVDSSALSKQRAEPIDWKSSNPDIKGVFESDLQTILKLAGRK